MYALSFFEEDYPNTYWNMVYRINCTVFEFSELQISTNNTEFIWTTIEKQGSVKLECNSENPVILDVQNNTSSSGFSMRKKFSIMAALFVVAEINRVYFFCIDMEQGDVLDMVCCENGESLDKTMLNTIEEDDRRRPAYMRLDEELLYDRKKNVRLNEASPTKTYCRVHKGGVVACHYYKKTQELYIGVAYNTPRETVINTFTF